MKTKLKNRLVSTLLAFAMVVSLLPADLLIPVFAAPDTTYQAADNEITNVTLTVTQTGDFFIEADIYGARAGSGPAQTFQVAVLPNYGAKGYESTANAFEMATKDLPTRMTNGEFGDHAGPIYWGSVTKEISATGATHIIIQRTDLNGKGNAANLLTGEYIKNYYATTDLGQAGIAMDVEEGKYPYMAIVYGARLTKGNWGGMTVGGADPATLYPLKDDVDVSSGIELLLTDNNLTFDLRNGEDGASADKYEDAVITSITFETSDVPDPQVTRPYTITITSGNTATGYTISFYDSEGTQVSPGDLGHAITGTIVVKYTSGPMNTPRPDLRIPVTTKIPYADPIHVTVDPGGSSVDAKTTIYNPLSEADFYESIVFVPYEYLIAKRDVLDTTVVSGTFVGDELEGFIPSPLVIADGVYTEFDEEGYSATAGYIVSAEGSSGEKAFFSVAAPNGKTPGDYKGYLYLAFTDVTYDAEATAGEEYSTYDNVFYIPIPVTITVTGDEVIKGTINVTAGPGGKVRGALGTSIGGTFGTTATSGEQVTGTDYTFEAQADEGYRFKSWSPALSGAGPHTKSITEGTTTYTASFDPNVVTVDLLLNNNADTRGKYVHLYDEGKKEYFSTAVQANTTTGKAVFTAVPNGDYSIHVGDTAATQTDTGIDITVDDNDQNPILRYYEIQLAKKTDGGSATANAVSQSTTAIVDVTTILANGSNSHVVTLAATPAANHKFQWSANQTAAGTWAGTTSGAAAGTGSWTLSSSYTGAGPIVLDPKFARTGVGANITVRLNTTPTDNLAVSISTNTDGKGTGAKTDTTAGGGKVRFDGLAAETTYYVTVTTSGYSGVYSFTTPADSDANEILDYYTVTFNANGGALSAGGTSTSTNVLSGTTTSVPGVAPRGGYTFGGWATTANGTTAELSTTATATGAITGEKDYFAIWTVNELEFTPKPLTATVGDDLGNSSVHANAHDAGQLTMVGLPSATFIISNIVGLPAGLTLEQGSTVGNIRIFGTPTAATTGAVAVTFDAKCSETNVTETFTVNVTINKKPLIDPTLTHVQDLTMAGADDGKLTFTLPSGDDTWPTGAVETTYKLQTSTSQSGTYTDVKNVTPGTIDNLAPGWYRVVATLKDRDNYTWASGNDGITNSVEIKDKGINAPTVTQSQTFEKNPSVRTAKSVSFKYTTGDWTRVTGVKVDNKTVSTYDTSTPGVVKIDCTVLEGLSLTNGTKSVELTFARDSVEPLTKTASADLLNVQTTYTVTFDKNVPSGATAPTANPSIANKVVTDGNGASFPYLGTGGIQNNFSNTSIPGYTFQGWDTAVNGSGTRWATGNYTPADTAATWNSTVYAQWTANKPTVTTHNITGVYGSDQLKPDNAAASANPVVAAVVTSGKNGDTYDYKLTGGTVPAGLTISWGGKTTVGTSGNYESGTGTVTISGKPRVVNPGAAVTIQFTATSKTNGESVNGTFTIEIAKATPTIRVGYQTISLKDPATGNNYTVTKSKTNTFVGDLTTSAATVTTVSGPYWDPTKSGDDKWVTLGRDTAGMNWTLAPGNLTSTSNSVTGTLAYAPGGTTVTLTDFWTTNQGTGTIEATATYDVTVQVRHNGSTTSTSSSGVLGADLRDGATVEFTKTGYSSSSGGVTYTIGTGHKATVKVPGGTYTVTLTKGGTVDSKMTANITANGTVYFDYYDVNYATRSMSTDHGEYGTAGSSTNTATSGLVLVAANAASTTKTWVKLPDTVADTNYKLNTWASSGTGTFKSTADGSGNSNLTGTNTAGAKSWAIGNHTGTGAVTLTPSFTPTGVNVTVRLFLNGAIHSGDNASIVKIVNRAASGETYGGAASDKVSGGSISFTNITAGTYDIYVGDMTTPTGVTHAFSSSNTTATLYYYDVKLNSTITNGTATMSYGGSTVTSARILANAGARNSKDVSVTGTATDANNYDLTAWAGDPSASGTFASFTKAPTVTTTWTLKDGYIGGGSGGTGADHPIILTPTFTKNRYDITVTVKRNGEVQKDQTVTLSGTDQTPQTDANGQMTIHGVSPSGTAYELGVKGWTGTKDVTISNKDETVILEYFDYSFNANKPSTAPASASVSGMPTNPSAPVIKDTSVDDPGATPTLAGYRFVGWGATDTATSAITWPQSIADETTFYAIWSANTISLANMTAYGALNVKDIRGFTASKGNGTDHTDGDFTYEVWDGTQWTTTHTVDGITVTAGAALAVSGTPTAAGTVAAPTTTTVFQVRAVSKINSMVSATAANSATTITVTSYPTYRVVYDKNSGGNDGSISGTLPTDGNLYVVSDKDFTGAVAASDNAPVVANTITASPDRLTWAGGARNHLGWGDSPTGSNAASFTVATVAAASKQNKAPGGTLTLYAIWEGKDLNFRSQTMEADYNMTGAQWLASSYYSAPVGGAPDVNLTSFDVTKFVGNGTNNLEFTVTNVPSFMEYNATTKILKLKDNTRVGAAKTSYVINVKVVDKGNGNKETTGTVTLTVHKTTPVIDGWGKKTTSTGPYYVGDNVWAETTFVDVHDKYETTKILSTPAALTTAASWADTTQTFKAGTQTYNYTCTPTDTANYNTPDPVSVTFEAAVRSIALQVQDDDKNTAWSNTYTNSNTPTYDPTPSWKTVKVKIRNPAASNSPVEKLTWSQTAGASDATFKDITVVQADGTSTRPSPSSLAAGDTGELILTFQVNIHASGNHTLAFKFDGISGEGKGSQKTASATYTYTTQSQANKLATPVPDLNIVQIDEAPGTTYKKQDGTDVDKEQGGVHLHFPAISQDKGTSNPVKEYVVKISGTGMTTQTIKIPATGSADGYNYYWEAKLPTDNSGPTPAQKYTVTVQAISNDTALYQHSDEGTDEDNAGYKVLHVANWGQLTDRTFNGRLQNGGSLTSPAGVGAITVRYYEDSTTPAATLPLTTTGLDTDKLHVNIDPENDKNEYAVYVTVAQGTLYLPIAEPTLYPYAGAAAGNDPYWKIKQATAAMALGQSSFSGQTMTPKDIRPNPTVTYPKGSGTGPAEYNDGTVTGYYDLIYTVISSPSSNYAVGDLLTETQLQTFMADKAGTYKFKANAIYKTDDDENLQFQADVSQAENTFSFTTGNRTVTSVKLERFEAVNGTTGVTGVDTDANLTEDRRVTYGNAVDKTDARRGYYDATDRDTSKQMRLDGLRVTVTWSGGEPDVYIVGTDGLPGEAIWTSSNTSVATSPAITDSFLTFKGAGVNKNFSTNLSITIKGLGQNGKDVTSNVVTYTMEKRPIDYKVVSDMERVWNNTPKVDGDVKFELPTNLTGDAVKIALSGNQFETTGTRYTDPAPTFGPDVRHTANSNVGKDKMVRAVKNGNAGSGADVTGADKAFYKRGIETPGKATITPSRVTKINVTQTEPSANTANGDNLLSNTKYNPTAGNLEDENHVGRGWGVSFTPATTQWEYWDSKTNDWAPLTEDHFSIDTVYRATVVVEADTNHYMSEDEIDNYTINNKKNGAQSIEDLDDWNLRPENKVEITVNQSGPFHPDWAPEEVLYHNRTTFKYIFHTFETPSLQFSDEEKSFDKGNPAVGTCHEPSNYVHHTETVTEGATGKTFTITVNAAVKDIFGAQVLMTNKELLDAGATLKVAQGNGTIDVATPVRTDKTSPMYKMTSGGYSADQDLIIYELTIPDSVMAKADTYHLEFQAMGSTSLANMEAGKVDVAKSYYTFTLVVKEKPQTIPGGPSGTTVIEDYNVSYWLSSVGTSDDPIGEHVAPNKTPQSVPTVTALNGYTFLGWSLDNPAKVAEPKLVDPRTVKITEDTTFYAVYKAPAYDHSHYVIGFPDGTFGPDSNITRGQVATIIARACLDDFREGANYGNPGGYSDVDKHWASSAIAYCSINNVFNGYEDGTFRPDDAISRQELATAVARLGEIQPSAGMPFTDSADVAAWAQDTVYTAYANGWIQGYEDGTFLPENDIKRSETVKIFNGYLERTVNQEGLSDLHEYVHSGVASNLQEGDKAYMTWPDVPATHWAYYEIIEAANDHNYHKTDEADPKSTEMWETARIDEIWRYHDDLEDGASRVDDLMNGTRLTEAEARAKAEEEARIKAEEEARLKAEAEAKAAEEAAKAAEEAAKAAEEAAKAENQPTDQPTDVTTPPADDTVGGEGEGEPTGETTPPTEESTPPAEETTPPVEESTPPVEETTPPTEETTPPTEETTPPTEESTPPAEESTPPTEETTPPVEETTPPIEEGNPSETMIHRAYINGFEDSTFRPDDAITRAAVASVIARTLLEGYDPELIYDTELVDLEGHWAKNYVAFCEQSGVFGGYEDGTFRPDQGISRQEFAVVLARLSELTGEGELTFTDSADVADWAASGVTAAVDKGWLKGYEDGTFLPEKLITRAEAVKLFNSFLGRGVNYNGLSGVTGGSIWSDVSPTHWAYLEIVEAANDHTFHWNDADDPTPPERWETAGEI